MLRYMLVLIVVIMMACCTAPNKPVDQYKTTVYQWALLPENGSTIFKMDTRNDSVYVDNQGMDSVLSICMLTGDAPYFNEFDSKEEAEAADIQVLLYDDFHRSTIAIPGNVFCDRILNSILVYPGVWYYLDRDETVDTLIFEEVSAADTLDYWRVLFHFTFKEVDIVE